MIKTLLAVALAASLCAPAHAGFYTGNKLHAALMENPRLVGIGFVTGVFDATERRGDYCAPQQVTVGQVVDIVAIYLRDHPEDRHLSAQSLVVYALSEVWPCMK